MARKRDRIFAGTMALLFLVTASTLTILVIFSLTQSGDSTQQDATSSQNSANKLAGTKMDNFTPIDNITELKTTDLKQGDGQTVKAGDSVTVDYTGAVAATGVIFQSSKDMGQPVSFSLDGVIKGWTEGIPGMKVGGTRRLFIPADLAYGSTPPPGSGIPANADLVFDVTLHSIGK